MGMELELKLTGRQPLLMHNQQLADPLNEHTRALAKLTGKRGKTEDDHRLIADTEYVGSLYVNSDGPFVPSTWIVASLIEGGKITKQGTNVKRAVIALDRELYLDYAGPRAPSVLVKDANFRLTASVKVGTSRTMRTRPMFVGWSLVAPLALETEIIDLDVFRGIAERAGRMIGIGDWRPFYGTYSVEIVG
jgi:hypothetical protein